MNSHNFKKSEKHFIQQARKIIQAHWGMQEIRCVHILHFLIKRQNNKQTQQILLRLPAINLFRIKMGSAHNVYHRPQAFFLIKTYMNFGSACLGGEGALLEITPVWFYR